jgi:hypothetical protein
MKLFIEGEYDTGTFSTKPDVAYTIRVHSKKEARKEFERFLSVTDLPEDESEVDE